MFHELLPAAGSKISDWTKLLASETKTLGGIGQCFAVHASPFVFFFETKNHFVTFVFPIRNLDCLRSSQEYPTPN